MSNSNQLYETLIDNYEAVSIPRIGDRAPQFRAVTSKGSIYFPSDYIGKWVILFSHPADFASLCSTEHLDLALMEQEFYDLNCKLIGLSFGKLKINVALQTAITDKIESNGKKKRELDFLLFANANTEISKQYGILHHDECNPKAIRAVFFIDPDAIIRGKIYDSISNGLNLEEYKRVIIDLQTSDFLLDLIPVNLIPGGSRNRPTVESYETAKNGVVTKDEKRKSCDCFFCASL